MPFYVTSTDGTLACCLHPPLLEKAFIMHQGSMLFRPWMALCFCVCFAVSSASGCALFEPVSAADEEPIAAKPESRGGYVAEYRAGNQKPKLQNFELVGQPTVQDALEQASVIKKFSGHDVVLIRTIPNTNRRHKMEITFDKGSNQIRPEMNYSLHPNDHLIIKQAAYNPIDDIFGSAFPSGGR